MTQSGHDPIIVCVASGDVLEQCLELRRAVFIEEQQIDEALEMDGLDEDSVHIAAVESGSVLGTARLRRSGRALKVQRVAVHRAARRRGIGTRIMRFIHSYARDRGVQRLRLSAQKEVVAFYHEIGYVADGPPHSEAGIPHQNMYLDLH